MTSASELYALHEKALGADLPWQGGDVVIDWDPSKSKHVLRASEMASDRIKLIPNTSKVRGKTGEWHITGRVEHMNIIRSVFDDHVTVTHAAQVQLKAPPGIAWEPPVPVVAYADRKKQEGLYLIEHQAEDVKATLANGGNGIFAHDQGLGKTIMATHWMSALYVPERNRMLVITTRATLYNWQEEIELHWPGVTTVIADGTLGQKKDAVDEAMAVVDSPVVLITTYDAIRSLTSLKSWGGKKRTDKQKQPKHFQDVNAYWGATVIDEAHRISNPKNVTSMAVGAVGDMSHYRLAMSGTIIRKASDDLWGVMHWVDPELVGSRSWYRDRYSDMVMEWHGRMVNRGFNEKTREELTQILTPIYKRRHKSEIPGMMGRLPTNYLEVPLTSQQEKQYVEMEEQMFSQHDENFLIAENGIVRDLYLRAIACGLVTVGDDGRMSGVGKPSNKMEAILDHITELSGEPGVIGVDNRMFANYISTILTKQKISHGRMVGGRKTYELQAERKEFQEGERQIMIVQYGVGSEGITLTRGNDVLLVQENWNWTETDQLISRVDRHGQEQITNVTVLHSHGTIDKWVREVNIRKMTLAEIINEDGLNMEDMTRGGILASR